MLELVAWIVGIFILLIGVRFFSLFQLLLRQRLAPPVTSGARQEEVPDYVTQAISPAVETLHAAGFEPLGYVARSSPVLDHDQPDYAAVLLHHDMKTVAFIQIAHVPEMNSHAQVEFETFFSDGSSLATVNGVAHTLFGVRSRTELQDPYAPTIDVQLKAHRTRVEERTALQPALLPTLDDFVLWTNTEETEHFHYAAATGRLGAAPDGHGYLMTVRGALAVTRRVLAGVTRVQAMHKARASLSPDAVDVPIEAEVNAFLRAERARRAPSRRLVLVWLFIISAALFAVSMSSWFEMSLVLVVVGVVLFHELGHFAAMKAFGYEDATIFFVPFLGAATSGRKTKSSVHHDMVVFLAGPVPGLLVAVPLLLLGPSSATIHTAAVTLLVLNLFNLLPVLPLDGGRVVHRLLFERNRYAEAGFRITGACAFIGLAVMGEATELVFIGGFMLLGLVGTLRIGALRRRIDADSQPTSSEPRDRALRIFSAIRAAGLGGKTFAEKSTLVCAVDLRIGDQRAGFVATVGWLFVYGLVLIVGGVAVVSVVAPGFLAADATEVTVELACSDLDPVLTTTTGTDTPVVLAAMPTADAAEAMSGFDTVRLGRLLLQPAGPDVVLPTLVELYRESGGQVSVHNSAQEGGIGVGFACDSISASAAAALRSYFLLPSPDRLVAPWVSPPVVSAEQEALRADYREVFDAVKKATATAFAREMDASFDGSHEALKRRLTRGAAAYGRAHARVIEAVTASASIDRRAIALYLASSSTTANPEIPANIDALGRANSQQIIEGALWGNVTEAAPMTTTIGFVRPDIGVPRFSKWLCNSGCGELVLRFYADDDAQFEDGLSAAPP